MSQENNNEEPQDGAIQVFKKWRQNPKSNEGGFISFLYWPKNHKVIVDIGTTKNGALVDNAKCFVNASQFMAYLRADVEDRVDHLFPGFFSESIKDSGWTSYGGGTKAGVTTARIFKVTYWPNDQDSRDFKCAHFVGTPIAQGAIKPDFNQPLKQEHIKVSMFELAELYESLNLAIMASKVHDKLEKLVFEEDN